MPTPRQHGGAALQHIPFNLPGFKGLNSQARSAIVGPEWATVLQNTVIDDNNRLAARKGWNTITTTPAAQAFTQLFEFDNGGSLEIHAAGSSALYMSDDGGQTWSDITNTATYTDTNIQFVEFAGTLLGLQAGGTIITYNGTNWSDLGATSEPTGGVGLAAFGRMWVKDTATTLKYCALLDETDWTGSDAGSFDLTSIWGRPDEITAIESFNGALVVFSERNIVVFTDGAGSALGLDPVTAYVADIVRGIGCVARDSVVNVKGDLWFLDDTGVHSLGRLISERSNPLNNISQFVQDEIIDRLALMSDKSVIRAAYSPKDRFYLLSLPQGSGSTENGISIVFDTRGPIDNGAFRCVGIWTGFVPRAVCVTDGLDMITARLANTGEVANYRNYQDDGSSYTMDYESGWLNMDDPHTKILKRLTGIFSIGGQTTVTYKWDFDFVDSLTNTAQVTYSGGADPAEWGTAEFGIAEFGAGATALEKKVAGRGTGEHVKLGFTCIINTTSVAVQQIALYAKMGRLR